SSGNMSSSGAGRAAIGSSRPTYGTPINRFRVTIIWLVICCKHPGTTAKKCTTFDALVAGLVPATHVFVTRSVERKEGVDGRAEPGQGDRGLCWSRHKQPNALNRTP